MKMKLKSEVELVFGLIPYNALFRCDRGGIWKRVNSTEARCLKTETTGTGRAVVGKHYIFGGFDVARRPAIAA